MKRIQATLCNLEETGNMRVIPADGVADGEYDLSSNDYLGLAADVQLRDDFLKSLTARTFLPASSASRLLATNQAACASLEKLLQNLYGRPALLFNSGYHANTGMIAALGGRTTLFVADKLVHASIIDGLTLSGSDFRRFRHNDLAHLANIVSQHGSAYDRVVVVAESVYSMDGDSPDMEALTQVKSLHPNLLLYVDEAHAVGVCGHRGLGLSQGYDLDIVVGTFGKALASVGAFAVMSADMRHFMVNRCRSLIFSTMLPPVVTAWSELTLRRSLEMDAERTRLRTLAAQMQAITNWPHASHIQAVIVGDPQRTVQLSDRLRREAHIKALPIRTPTVPPGTDRLRLSLSAALPDDALHALRTTLVTR